jgi:hypothetical protein
MLKPVVSSREHGSAFVPDDPLVVKESDPQQAIQNLAGEFRGVPDIGHLETGNQRKGIGPVGAGSPDIEVSVCPVVRFM